MSNPYDFSSGYLAGRQIKEQERKNQADEQFRKDVMGPYYESVAGENRAKSRYYGVLGRNATLEGNVKRAKGLDMFGWDPLGEWSEENPFGFSYTPAPAPTAADGAVGTDFTTPSYGITPAKPTQTNGLKVPRYANGSKGGVQLTADKDVLLQDQPGTDVLLADATGATGRNSAINTGVVSDASPVANGQAAPAAAPAQPPARPRDPALLLKEENPDSAKAIAMNFYTAPMKDIPRMLEKVSKWDMFEGKITSKDLIANINAVKTMQAEGVAEAMSLAMMGNKKAALKAFASTGSDFGEDVVDLKPIKIKNPVAGVIKGVEDQYEGVQVVYKDGSTMNWDPRKFLISTASLKEYLSSKDSVENNLRQQASSKYGDDVRAETNRINAGLREDAQRARLEDQAIGRITGEAKSELTRQTNAFLDPKSPTFIADENARELRNRQIEAGIRPAMDVAIQNVTLFGNRGATVNGVLQAMNSQQPALGADGKPVVDIKGGQKFVKMASGVWLPVTDQQK